MKFTVNRAATPYLSHVGKEKTPVFILDNFLLNLSQDLLNDLDQLSFNDSPTYYPGIRAKLPDAYLSAVGEALIPLLYKIYAIPNGHTVQFFDSYFSLVTRAPEALSLEQQIPHFDGTDTYRFALLHYLNPNPHGGTAFYRHNLTELERVYETNVEDYLNSVGEYFKRHGEPTGRYIDGSNRQFTRIGEIPYVQNRMAIYPGNLLHSGTINPATDIDPSPISGRLTANIFVNFIPG